MANKLDLRQSIYRGALSQIASGSNPEGDNLLNAINNQLTPLLKMSAQSTPSLVVDVGSGDLTDAETDFRRAIPHVGSAYVQFSSGTITFPAASGGNIVCSPGNNTVLTVASGNYVAVLIYLDGSGDLNALPGTDNAVLATAVTNLPPAPTETLPLGFIVAQNVAGTIQNIEQDDIAQFGTGAGGGGSGDADSYLETLKNRFIQSPFTLLTPYIIRTDGETLRDGTSTAVYSLISKTINFPTIGNQLITTQLADTDEFLANDNAVSAVELVVFWDADFIDPIATYSVSRNGGSEWQTITMERVGDTDTFRGYKEFADESVNQTLSNLTSVVSSFDLDATSQRRLAQAFTLTDKVLAKTVTLELNKTGSPAGNLIVQIVADNSGNPSTDPADILSESASIPMSSISSGTSSLVVNIPDIYLVAGTYHIVLKTDAAYQVSYVNGTTELAWRGNNAASTPYLRTFNGTVWATSTGNQGAYTLTGIEIDIRVRITSATTDVKLKGLGLFYEQDPSEFVIDASAKIIEQNHLGSLETELDRSQPGYGIYLRRPDGTLREISIDNDDNIVIYST